MSRGMIISIETVSQVSMRFGEKKKVDKNMGISIKHNTNNTYEKGDKFVRLWKRLEMRIHV